MKTIKIICMLMIAMALLAQGSLNAQSTTQSFQSKKEKINAQKAAFITSKLNLSADESKNFWPVYNEFEAKKDAIRKDFNKEYKSVSADSVSETKAKELITAQLKMEQDILDLKKEYMTKFLAVLPASKVLKLQEAEQDFKKFLLKVLQEVPHKPMGH